jgi:hypothetical protein
MIAIASSVTSARLSPRLPDRGGASGATTARSPRSRTRGQYRGSGDRRLLALEVAEPRVEDHIDRIEPKPD